jgi:hypothetical protein
MTVTLTKCPCAFYHHWVVAFINYVCDTMPQPTVQTTDPVVTKTSLRPWNLVVTIS